MAVKHTSRLFVGLISVCTWMASIVTCSLPHYLPLAARHWPYDGLVAAGNRYPGDPRYSPTAEYYLNALQQPEGGNGRFLPIPWAEVVFGVDPRDRQESQEEYEDQDYLEDGYPVYGEEDAQMDDEVDGEITRSLDDDRMAIDRNPDSYNGFMLRYFMNKMARHRPPKTETLGSPRVVQRRNNLQRTDSSLTPTVTPTTTTTLTSTSTLSSTLDVHTGEVAVTETTSSATINPKVARDSLKPTLLRGQKEFPLLRPAAENRQSQPTWPPLPETHVAAHQEDRKPAQVFDSSDTRLPPDILMAQLDSLKSRGSD